MNENVNSKRLDQVSVVFGVLVLNLRKGVVGTITTLQGVAKVLDTFICNVVPNL